MFNIFEELSWPQFTQLSNVAGLPLNEQIQYYNQYLSDLNIARQNWIDTQNKGPLVEEEEEYVGLLQENGAYLLQENGAEIIIT
jgi:hypothetical protein